MSQTPKVQRFLVVSGSSEFTLSVSQAAVPTHVEPSGSIARATDGTLWQSLDGGNWQSLGGGTPDGSTLSILTGVLNALPLSGTVNARFVNLSGTIDGHFNTISGTVNSAIVALSGTVNSGIVALSGTIDARFKSIWPAGDVDDLSGSIASAIAHVGSTGGTPDGSTLSSVTGVLNALPLSGTVDAKFKRNPFTLTGDLVIPGSISGSGDAIFNRNIYLSGALTGSRGARFNGPLDMGSKTVSNMADPVAGQDAVTLAYFNANAGNVSGSTAFHDTTLSGSGLVSSPLTVLPRYMGAWTAGTYPSGAVVTRNGYTFAANRTTSEDPLFSEGDISSSANWLLGSSGINNVPISGGYAGAPDTYAVFVNNQTSKTGQAISKSTGSDWNGKIIAYDAAINGGADAFSFGIMDAAYPFTSVTGGAPLNGVPTAWGVYVDIFNQRISSLIDGTASLVIGYSKTDITAKGNSIDRWYVNWALTGSSSASIEFWRNDASNLNNPRLLVKFTVPKPTYTAYRVAAGGWSGGIAGTHFFRGATTRVSSSGDWTRIGSSNPGPGLA